VSTFAAKDEPALSRVPLNSPCGIDVDRYGNIYVASRIARTIHKISPRGQATTLAVPKPTAPIYGIAVWKDNVYFVSGSSVWKFSEQDSTRQEVVSKLPWHFPYGLCISTQGTIYVTDFQAQKNNGIYKINPSGAFTNIGTDKTWQSPSGIAVDKYDNVYVAEAGAGAVVIIEPSGTTRTIKHFQMRRPVGISLSPWREIFVTDVQSHLCYRISHSNTFTIWGPLDSWRQPQSNLVNSKNPSEVRWGEPSDIAVFIGCAYVCEILNNSVRKITFMISWDKWRLILLGRDQEGSPFCKDKFPNDLYFLLYTFCQTCAWD